MVNPIGKRLIPGSGAVRRLAPAIRPVEARADLKILWKFLAPSQLVRRGDLANMPDVIGSQITDKAIRNSDTLLLLGSNDPGTVDVTEQLHRKNPQLLIVASGKGGHRMVPEPAYKEEEAMINAAELARRGIPRNKVRIEALSTNTGANISNSRELLYKMDDKYQARRVIIVQSPAAQLRATLCFERLWGEVYDWEYYISYPPQVPDIGSMPVQKLQFNLACALREATRMINYSYNPRFDYQTKRTVPHFILQMIMKYHNRCSSMELMPSMATLLNDTCLMQYLADFFGKAFECCDGGYPV